MVNVNLTYLVASSCWLEGKMKPCTEINSLKQRVQISYLFTF